MERGVVMQVRSRGAAPAKVDVQLTPMIDVVFQLLAFFLVTFRVAAVEGDFSLKLPRTGVSRGTGGWSEQIAVRLTAGPDGDLRQASTSDGIGFASRDSAAGFRILSAHIARQVAAARAAGQAEPEVRIAADDGLRYEFIIDAVAAASHFVADDGRIVPSARKVSIVEPEGR
jgi:biopolymer transport protein ExbD